MTETAYQADLADAEALDALMLAVRKIKRRRNLNQLLDVLTEQELEDLRSNPYEL